MSTNEPAHATQQAYKRTPLFPLHQECKGKIVPFAGYEMPLNYPLGILKEHLHTRAAAGLFDVSHMAQVTLKGDSYSDVAGALETLVPAELLALKPGRLRYTMLLNDDGGIIDDIMVARPAEAASGQLDVVVNAARASVDIAHLRKKLAPLSIDLVHHRDRALLALQGPAARHVLREHAGEAGQLASMTGCRAHFDGIGIGLSCSGYTGEDGFELSVGSDDALTIARALLAHDEVELIGLGARDSLRLEAGLCLYGHDIDETTSPVEAALAWTIGKRRRGEGGFPGAVRIQQELQVGPARLRVGLKPEGKAPAREGTEVLDQDGARIGVVTSGGYAPSLGGPIAMGYVDADVARSQAGVRLCVRGRTIPAAIVDLPFVPARRWRKEAA